MNPGQPTIFISVVAIFVTILTTVIIQPEKEGRGKLIQDTLIGVAAGILILIRTPFRRRK